MNTMIINLNYIFAIFELFFKYLLLIKKKI